MDLGYYGSVNLIIDGAALYILVGMIIYTTLYRRRGKPEDKLFFSLVILDIAAAFLNGLPHVLIAAGVHFGIWPFAFIFSVFNIIFDLFGVIWCIYLMFRMKWDAAKIRKFAIAFSVPAVILIVVTAINAFTDFLFQGLTISEDVVISYYVLLTLIPIFIYGICTFVIAFRKGIRVIILFVSLFAAQIFLTSVLATNITPLVLAVYLIYAHLFAMRDSFYEEVSD